ncbi:MAG: hypothetical protein UU85_C0004G0025 [Candidatus Wolfebacteria bacterium GW2011_GWA2_42_10]|uniref:Alpha-D-phosphohexomutase alpha/beta/alpha domain-containing protein n=2 Tax=Candidatus Wolfeibacteriota TaxID=1752735 RepID=A0A0G0ZTG0_9BACT|nr:MAG: hypothetical protein UU38_C0001G0087 [Candidatus Wolfebacteria bacterium GW2011_GWB1_41_12]KKS25266.1 MAG: hypothetical protein UU85_C0004G0025 [Candidatus Wolfebacteria bacterium GW2011_GWA2_42_10]KKT56706.1 MAG: hypothetical protein UW50_C0001G0275 [Candidatus Wolfebacteria bacterium GW2011_GWA1_44_24]
MKMNPKIFKAYDIRGKYPREINENIVMEIVDKFLPRKLKIKIIIGRDARLSSPNLYKAAIKRLKIQSADWRRKLKIVPAGLITTPMLSFLVNYLKADFGIMITASHNPKEYNGLKIVGKNAMPISGKDVLQLL